MSQAFESFSGLTYAKRSLERSFQNFTSSTLNSVPGLTLQGYPRLHWDFSRVIPRFDDSFGKSSCIHEVNFKLHVVHEFICEKKVFLYYS